MNPKNPTPVQLFRTMVQATVLQAMNEALADADVWKCCLHCKHFTEATELCALAGGTRPPARVITFGCHVFDDGEPKAPEEPTPVPVVTKPVTHYPPLGRFMDMDDDIPF